MTLEITKTTKLVGSVKVGDTVVKTLTGTSMTKVYQQSANGSMTQRPMLRIVAKCGHKNRHSKMQSMPLRMPSSQSWKLRLKKRKGDECKNQTDFGQS